jgi:LuxR family transcriptional regulator, maltose regulon positive regulatory protein
MESVEIFAAGGVLLAHVKMAQGNGPGSTTLLDEAEEFVFQHKFTFRMSDVIAAQIVTLLFQSKVTEAVHLAQTHEWVSHQAPGHPGK